MANYYINLLADELAKAKIEVRVHELGFTFVVPPDKADEKSELIEECLKNGTAMDNFYRSRLEVKVTE